MKKILPLTLCAIAVLSLVTMTGCASDQPQSTTTTTTTEETTVQPAH